MSELEPGAAVAAGSPNPALAPTAAPERVIAVDVIRGFALLGILPMNIVLFGLPSAAYENPTVAGGFTGANFAEWLGCHLLCEAKMMTIFSMLFGAGLVLMASRAEARGRSPAGIYYRRVLWLLVFGLVHAYLIWAGDILYTYAMCGLVLYLFRRKSPRTLLIVAAIVLLVPVPLEFGFKRFVAYAKQVQARVEAQVRAGRTPSEHDKGIGGAWTGMRSFVQPSAEDLAHEIRVHRGSYAGIVQERASEVIMIQTWVFAMALGWEAGGRMLLGMALMKLGVFSAARSARFYGVMAAIGYGVGLPVVAIGAGGLISTDFDFFRSAGFELFNEFGSILVALGHVGALVLVLKAGAVPWLTRRLAAVGRMALSNYLLHSLVCTTLFYGYGFGLFGRLDRVGLLGVVVAVWTVQLLFSPLWLRTFRFGPAEWLWRSLTYWQPQPMLIQERA